MNTPKNLLAVDVQHVGALATLRSVTYLDGIQVGSNIPLGSDVVTGVFYDVDVAIPNNDLPILVKPANDEVTVDVTRLDSSRCVKIAFKGKYLPSHFNVGHFRHAVRPFILKPLQCRKCVKLGHVCSVCENQAACPRCAEPHAADKCGATVMKCLNCSGSQEASSKNCSHNKKEMAILKKKNGEIHLIAKPPQKSGGDVPVGDGNFKAGLYDAPSTSHDITSSSAAQTIQCGKDREGQGH